MGKIGLFLYVSSAFLSVASATSPLEGIWLDQEEAQELRTTGKLQSLCEEVRKDPASQIVNSRLIERSGDVYLYDPRSPKIPEAKMGNINLKTGKMTLVPAYKQQMGPGEIRAVVAGSKLTFVFRSGKTEVGLDYVRSTRDELMKYFAALDSCKIQVKKK